MNLLPSAEDLQRLRESQNVFEKQGIIRRLSNIPSAIVVYPILNALTSGEQNLIKEAANALVKLKVHSENILKTEITNKNCFIRWAIALAFQKMDDPSLTAALIPSLGIGYEPVIKIVCNTIARWNPERFPSSKLKDILDNLTHIETEQVGQYATRQLGIRALDSTETLYALKILHLLNWDLSIVPLLKVSYHSDYRIREEAQKNLKSFSTASFYSVCLKYMKRKDIAQKYDFELLKNNYPLNLFAIEGLGHIGLKYEDVEKVLTKFLSTGKKLEKFFVIRALNLFDKADFKHFMKKPRIKDKIKQFLKEVEGTEKLESIHLLGALEEEWVISFLLSFIKDENPEIRLSVLNAIYNSPTDNVLEKIAFLLIDESIPIRKATVRLFEELEPEKYQLKTSEGNIIDKLPEVIKSKILTRLTESLETENQEYRSFAAFWLGTLNHKPAIEKLIKQLNHFDDEVRISTINALGIIGSPQAIPNLLPLIFEENSRIPRKVIETIGNLGEDGEGVRYLIHQLFLEHQPHPSFLEKYVLSFGAKVIPILSSEIANEYHNLRKEKLQKFLLSIVNQYRINSEDSFDIIL
jgi:HEAT repeat protein